MLLLRALQRGLGRVAGDAPFGQKPTTTGTGDASTARSQLASVKVSTRAAAEAQPRCGSISLTRLSREMRPTRCSETFRP